MEYRKALPVHHTEVSEGPWDGPKNEANLRNDGDAEYYRQAYAWVDPEADPDTKSAYKFIHHEVSRDGEIGPANLRACQTGIAILNGARGGANIPESDLEGVWEHLAAHIRDAGREPAPLRSLVNEVDALMGDYEVRSAMPCELRVIRSETTELGTLVGKPGVPYGSWSDDLGGFVESIIPGAVDYEGYDVVCCRDHEDFLVLGRVSNGTLRLVDTDNGLNYECDLPDVSYSRDLIALVERGDVRGSSFRFTVLEDEWQPARENGLARRVIHKMRLYEVGPVTMPAYPSTALSLRSLLGSLGIDASELGVAVRRVRAGQYSGRDIDTIIRAIHVLEDCLRSSAQGPEEDQGSAQGRLSVLRRRLRLLEI